MNGKFNFRQHQHLTRNWRTLIRFSIYIIVLAIILYLIYGHSKAIDKTPEVEIIEEIDIIISDES